MANKKNTDFEKDKEIIRVHQEALHISKEVVEKRKIQIHKNVHTETVTHDIPLLNETIKIEHIDFNKEITEIPKVRVEGNVTIIPVIEEVAMVTKKLMLVKEVYLTKEQHKKVEHIENKLRKETVTIDKMNLKDSK